MDNKEAKKILFLCDTSDIDIVEKSFADVDKYSLTIETSEKIFDYGITAYLEHTADLINRRPELYDGVVGTHDSSAVFAAILCELTGKTFASVDSVVNCQNKYLSRIIQSRCCPEYIPDFCLDLEYFKNLDRFPGYFFIKPVRANISFGSHAVSSPEELQYYITWESREIVKQNDYFFEAMNFYSPSSYQFNIESCNRFLCEGFVSGEQVTVDGFIYQGEVRCFGITKAVFHEHSNSFSHHEFPYEFTPGLEKKILDCISKLIPALGIENSFFNIEFRVDQDKEKFYIIEVNSRIAFQFAKTIQAVSGTDPLHLLCDVAVGDMPFFTMEYAQFSYCYNFELHHFFDKNILKTPTQSDYEEIKLIYPEVHVRNLVSENTLLSDYKHNPDSYRYCIIDVPGNNREEILAKYKHIFSMLNYEFEEI